MLSLNVTVENDKVVISNLQQFAGKGLLAAVQRGISRSVKGIYRFAYDFLSGEGSKGITETHVSRTGKTYQKWTKRQTAVAAGGWPVPLRTGTLRRLLDFVLPGESKTAKASKEGTADSFSTGPMEGIVYDSALYSRVIHEGTGSSAKYGAREYLLKALERFNEGAGIAGNINDEIGIEIASRGLA